MYLRIRQILITYMSLILMVIQGVNATATPYRVAAIVSSSYNAIANPALLFPASAGLAGLALSNELQAATLEPPEHSCEPGYDKVSGKCMMQETASIIPVCPNGFSPQVVRDVVLDKPVNTCVANKSKTAEVVCPSGWVSGGANGQQCRHETSPDAYGICPNGYTKSSGQCVTAWRFEAPSQYVCSDLCNIDLSNPLSTCPADQDPIALARVNNKATCTAEGAAQGKCREGEIIYVEFPELDWTIESPIPSPTSSNPVMCYRKAYEAQKRDCPTPNQNNSSGRQNGEPLWGTPTGLDADNPLYYDSVTGAPTTCLRTWMQDLNVSCPVGTIFDQTLNGCINELSAECPSGTTYSNGQCIGGDGKQCPTTHYFDEKSSVCTPKLSDPSDFNEQYNSGADLAWAIGGLQSGKVQGANKQGDVTLDMGLLNQEADRELQANKDNFKDVVAIGENDRTHNQYSSIDNTFGNEKEQTTVIQTNHGSYQSYLNDSDPEHPNLAAEAYALVDDNIHKNRPPAIDPSDDWLDSSKDINKGIGDGTDPYFGDCEVGGTKTVLNPDKQIITQESCTKPVTMNFSSCKVQRYIEEPVIKIIEGADKAEVEVIANDTIRITMGEICDNCLNDGGQACKTYTRNVVVQMTKDIGVKKATFTKSLYDDMIVIAADGNEVFRAAKAPWNVSGWPSAGQSCENGTSYTWNGSIDATQQFQEALADDNRIDFNYKIGVGGGGEAHAVVVIQFDQDIRTDWFDEPRYEPENCFDRYTSGECTATGWECDLIMPPNTLGMEDWEEWDGVRNWNITNQGYDARSTQNGAFSAYGSMQNVGNLWFRGDVTVPSNDDDSFGFMIGYPEAPHFNKDPDNADYDPNATDQEYNHYYVLLWTSNHRGSNGSYYGLSFYKSYVPYSTLEKRFPSYWGINFHNDMYETDRFGNSVRILDVIHSDRTPWSPGRKYEIEYKQDEFGYVKFWIDDTLRIDIPPELETIKTGRFGFATISLNNVFFEGMEKVVPYDFGPLFPGDSDPSRCVQGHAVDFRCGALSDNGSILGPSGSVWTYDKLQEMDNTCAPLEAREDCSWVKRECVEGFEQPDGSCLAEKEIYNCVDNSNAWEEVPMENTCSVLPCSGGECDHRGEEVNPDFADVVTQIALISEMREYMDCSDPDDINTCQVYKGDQRTCSYDQFGMIDCCEEFKGKTIDFFAVTLNLMTVASFESEMFGIEESMASQAWGSMEGYVPTIDFGINEQDGITAELGQVGQDITDGAKSWIGLEKPQTEKFAEGNETAHGEKSSEESPNDSSGADTDKVFLNWAKEMIKDEIIDEMVAQAIDYIVDLLPEIMQEAMASAGEALFAETVKSQVTDEAAKQAAGAAVEAIAAFMGAVSVAIAVIKIAQAVYQLLNGCDDSEMDMPQVLKEKKCFYSHTRDCDKKFGICMRKYEKKWCCFSSIMSRIIMEQAIYQPQPFGGRAKSKSEWYNNEQCRGLTLAEIPLVDFSSINLDEWYDLMVQSGTLPDGQDTLEEWTKDNSYANPYGRSDSLQLQYDRGVEDFNEEYREVMDRSDVLGEADCSETSNLQGCKTGIFAD